MSGFNRSNPFAMRTTQGASDPQTQYASMLSQVIPGTSAGAGSSSGGPMVLNRSVLNGGQGPMPGNKPNVITNLLAQDNDRLEENEVAFAASPSIANRMPGAQQCIYEKSIGGLNKLLAEPDSGVHSIPAGDVFRMWRLIGLAGGDDKLLSNRRAGYGKKNQYAGILKTKNIWLNQYTSSRMKPGMHLFVVLLRMNVPSTLDEEKSQSQWVCMPLASDTLAISQDLLNSVDGDGRVWEGGYRYFGQMIEADMLAGNERTTALINDYLQGKTPFSSLRKLPNVVIQR